MSRLFRTMMLMTLLFFITSCASASSPKISTTPTINSGDTITPIQSSPTDTFTPTVASAANVGPVPADCSAGPTPQDKFSAISSVIGVSPVWVTGFSGPHAAVHLMYDRSSPYGGWPKKLVWEIGPHYNQSVTLHAGSLRDNTLLKFDFSPVEPVTVSPVLNPQTPNHPVSAIGADWEEWGSYLFLPGAGCYYLEASWPGGHWRITFAAGL